jgi:uncharacterized protein YdeI (YjbR/CyaY-like superfamily)
MNEEKDAFYPKDRAAWRNWLSKNHQKKDSIWLILYKKDSGTATIDYGTAVEEALCFGWIDSKPNKRDSNSYYLFFAKRKPSSNWSALNKTRVAKLQKAGLMMPAGQAMIDIAQQNGKWDALNEVDQLIIPKDLQAAFKTYPGAAKNFDAFPPSAKRGILEWIGNAKTPETRTKRLIETASLAAKNIRANQYIPKSKP